MSLARRHRRHVGHQNNPHTTRERLGSVASVGARLPPVVWGRRHLMSEQEQGHRRPGRHFFTWRAWWALMMALWVAADDSFQLD
jgi:hypothetical protein